MSNKRNFAKLKAEDRHLVSSERRKIANVMAGRVVTENVLGRQCRLQVIRVNKFRRPETKNNDYYFRLSTDLTNVPINCHPLYNCDGRKHDRCLEWLHKIAETGLSKRRVAQSAFRKRHKHRLERKAYVGRRLAVVILFNGGKCSDES